METENEACGAVESLSTDLLMTVDAFRNGYYRDCSIYEKQS
jgi:hypothetical protein